MTEWVDECTCDLFSDVTCFKTSNRKLSVCVSTQDSISFVRSTVKEVITSMDSNLTCSLLKLLDCFFQPFVPREVTVLLCIEINRI